MYRVDKALFWHPKDGDYNYDAKSFYANITSLPDFMTDDTSTDRDTIMMIDMDQECVTWNFHHTRYTWNNSYGALLVYEYTTMHPRYNKLKLSIVWV